MIVPAQIDAQRFGQRGGRDDGDLEAREIRIGGAVQPQFHLDVAAAERDRVQEQQRSMTGDRPAQGELRRLSDDAREVARIDLEDETERPAADG